MLEGHDPFAGEERFAPPPNANRRPPESRRHVTHNTYGPEYQTKKLKSILDKFRPSLVERAIARLPSVSVTDYGWRVLGKSSLGDEYGFYDVVLIDTKYHCSCHEHWFGDVRQSRMCSHVLAVIIKRYMERGAKLS